MGFIPQITCRHCGEKYSGLWNRCPHCGTRRVKQASRPTGSTTAAKAGTAAAARESSNNQMQFIFGCVLVVAIIAAVIILISASLGGGGKNEKIDITGTITWNDAASPVERPASVTVNLLANGQAAGSVAVSPAEDGSWAYEFEKQAKYDEEGEEIKYSVGVSAISNFASTVAGYNITISYVEPEPVVPEEPEPPAPAISSIEVITSWGSKLQDQENQFAMSIGDEVDLNANTFPVEVEVTVQWRSTDEDICTVDENGVVTGVGSGWGSVIAYVGEVEMKIDVLVW